MLDEAACTRLVRVLGVGQERGLIGPGDPESHVDHAGALVTGLEAPRSFLDLGSGGGVPGLVLAALWPGSTGILLDSRSRCTRYLEWAAVELELGSRIEVRRSRAEVAAHDGELRERFDLVVARSFGAPATTAECGTGFVERDGRIVVSEPPVERASRWPEQGLARLGLRAEGRCGVPELAPGVVLRKVEAADPRWPRRVGVPSKRPLW